MMTHEEILKRILDTKKLELNELLIQHRINLAVHEKTKNHLYNDIDLIEKQLDKKG